MTTADSVATFREVATVPVGPGPHLHLGYVKPTGQIWVSDGGGNSITVLDHRTGELLDTWRIGAGPAHFSFDPTCDRGLVALREADQAAIVDPRRRTVLARVDLPAGSRPTGTMPAFDRGLVYTLNQGNATATAIDIATATVHTTVPVGGQPMWGQPWGASYKPITKPVGKTYVVSTESDSVTVFDDHTNQVLTTIEVGSRPNRNAVFREHHQIYVSNEGDDTVSIISIAEDRLVATVPVEHRPFRMLPVAAIGGRDEMWVLHAQPATAGIVAIDGANRTVSRTVATVADPANWVVSPEKRLFIVAATQRRMQVIDLPADRELASVELSHDPAPGAISGLIFTAARTLFVLNDDNTVSLFRDDVDD